MLPEEKDNGQAGGEETQEEEQLQQQPPAGAEGAEQQDQEERDDDDNEEEEEEELSPEEFAFLDRQLDQLNSALDSLEQRNDRLHGELRELLQSSREARQIIHQVGVEKEQQQQQPDKSKDDNEKPMDQG